MSAQQIATALLSGYKRWISPWLPAACRFEPSCSEYARDAIAIHGLWRGATYAAQRLLRCQPLSRGGFDPVPQREVEID